MPVAPACNCSGGDDGGNGTQSNRTGYDSDSDSHEDDMCEHEDDSHGDHVHDETEGHVGSHCGQCGWRIFPGKPHVCDSTNDNMLGDDADAEEVDEEVEENGSEGKMSLPEVGKEEQLLVAGAGTGTTLSLLGLALRRRLFGSTL